MGKDSGKTRESSMFFFKLKKREEKWDNWGQSVLSYPIPSRLDGVTAVNPALSLRHAWTEHTSKHFSKFFDKLKIDDRCTKHSSNAAAAAFILPLCSFLSPK